MAGSSATTVTVASKLPHGLVLQLQELFKVGQRTDIDAAGKPVQRDMVIHKHVGPQYVLKGVAPVHARIEAGDGTRMAAGFALTPGIPSDFWAKWKAQNADSDVLTKGIVFAHEGGDTTGQARDHVGERSGFEPVDPKNLPNEFKRTIQPAAA
ncbi:hypothetical protein LOK46_10620 [Methylobacterium sp. NMS14P]|uniref:hypothetical protein n=1 Tax=Methylobacterium sp. NMS14P TaxID=2894310 RepID=UPI002358D2AA|nr:hypothetical protein [Methylobacterium sp. NMS14P]WCS27243.1 hypothetical protein LOK46_10620 [Methylobacterium sp. NMS14P]